MGTVCSHTTDTAALELLSDAYPSHDDLWKFINPKQHIQKYGFLNSRGNSRWRIGFSNKTFIVYDIKNDVSGVATVNDVSDDGFTLTATINYVVRQSVYAEQTTTKKHAISFEFSLKDDIKQNLQSYGWRTKVTVYEQGHFLEYVGLV